MFYKFPANCFRFEQLTLAYCIFIAWLFSLIKRNRLIRREAEARLELMIAEKDQISNRVWFSELLELKK